MDLAFADFEGVGGEGVGFEGEAFVVFAVEGAGDGGAVFLGDGEEAEFFVDDFGGVEDVVEEVAAAEAGGDLGEVGAEEAGGEVVGGGDSVAEDALGADEGGFGAFVGAAGGGFFQEGIEVGEGPGFEGVAGQGVGCEGGGLGRGDDAGEAGGDGWWDGGGELGAGVGDGFEVGAGAVEFFGFREGFEDGAVMAFGPAGGVFEVAEDEGVVEEVLGGGGLFEEGNGFGEDGFGAEVDEVFGELVVEGLGGGRVEGIKEGAEAGLGFGGGWGGGAGDGDFEDAEGGEGIGEWGVEDMVDDAGAVGVGADAGEGEEGVSREG